MIYATGNSTFDSTVALAESVRQVAVAAATTQSAITAATLTYLQAVVAAGVAANIQTPTEVQAIDAINSTGNP